MKRLDNLTFIQNLVAAFCVSSIIGISLGFAKYYGVPVVLDRSIDAWDSAVLVFSAVYLGLKSTVYGRLIK